MSEQYHAPPPHILKHQGFRYQFYFGPDKEETIYKAHAALYKNGDLVEALTILGDWIEVHNKRMMLEDVLNAYDRFLKQQSSSEGSSSPSGSPETR